MGQSAVHHFCTYFDSNYLPRALALYDSLKHHAGDFRLWALCMDDASARLLARADLPEVRIIPFQEFERGDEALLAAKGNRSRIEYYFTCTPSLPLYVLGQCPEAERVTYVDADLYFFADPGPIYEEMGESSILAIGHRFPPALKHCEANGIYNVGFLSFRRDEEGLACLEWWRERCLEWCYDRYEDGRFADQKYLDNWPRMFSRVCILQHKGAGLAPWNVANYDIGRVGEAVLVDGERLVFYHFHGLKQVGPQLFDAGLQRYGARLDGVVRQWIYRPYLQAVLQSGRRLPTGGVRTPTPMKSIRRAAAASPRLRSYAGRVRRMPRNALSYLRTVLHGEMLLALGGRVW